MTVITNGLDTTSGKHGHEKVLDAFRNNEIDVMVGHSDDSKGA